MELALHELNNAGLVTIQNNDEEQKYYSKNLENRYEQKIYNNFKNHKKHFKNNNKNGNNW